MVGCIRESRFARAGRSRSVRAERSRLRSALSGEACCAHVVARFPHIPLLCASPADVCTFLSPSFVQAFRLDLILSSFFLNSRLNLPPRPCPHVFGGLLVACAQRVVFVLMVGYDDDAAANEVMLMFDDILASSSELTKEVEWRRRRWYSYP